MGIRKYYGVGFDSITKEQLFTVKGHFGTKKDGEFSDLITKTIY